MIATARRRISSCVLLGTILLGCGHPLPESPTPDPAIVSRASGFAMSADGNTPPTGEFVVHLDPASGRVPVRVSVNMCRSTDPDADDDLRFTVEWGDGEQGRGTCRLDHTYTEAGDYQGRACVSDRVLGSVTACRDFGVTAVDSERDGAPFSRTQVILPFGLYASSPPQPPGAVTRTTLGVSNPLTRAEAQAAVRITVTLTVTPNTWAGFRLGTSNIATQTLFVSGAPDLGGQAGTFTYQLTPGQFTDAVDGIGVEATIGPGLNEADVLGGTIVYDYR